MQELGRILNRYLFPIILICLGLFLVIISGSQSGLFLFGGIGILAVGIVSTLFVKGLISQKLQVILTVCVAAISIYFAYQDYAVIQEKIDLTAREKKVDMHIIQRLKDIRKAQLAFLKENGRYAPSFDSLSYFLKTGEVTLIKRYGARPDSIASDEAARELGLIQKMPEGMTEEQVIASGIMVRDTVKVAVMSYVFDEDDKKTRKTPFYADSLAYVPFTTEKFQLKTAKIDKGGVSTPVILVYDPTKPVDKQLKIGSLTDASTAGSWKE